MKKPLTRFERMIYASCPGLSQYEKQASHGKIEYKIKGKKIVPVQAK